MKKTLALISLALITGCSSVEKRQEAAFWAGWTVQQGATVHMLLEPPVIIYYCLSKAALDAMVIDDAYTAARLKEALEIIPVDDEVIKSAAGELIWSGVIPIWQRYGNKLVELDDTETVKEIVDSIRRGLATSLAPYQCR